MPGGWASPELARMNFRIPPSEWCQPTEGWPVASALSACTSNIRLGRVPSGEPDCCASHGRCRIPDFNEFQSFADPLVGDTEAHCRFDGTPLMA